MPHAITVEVEELDEKVVRANVYVETESQKQIVVGKRGGRWCARSARARGPRSRRSSVTQVFLELQVKVRPRWRRDESACSSGSGI